MRKLAPLIETRKSRAHGFAMRAANTLPGMAKERRRNITPADKQAAAKLKALWDAAVPVRKAEGRPLTQEIMAERLASAIGRGTQGLVSQYLNGYIALNYRALLAFADEVGFEPEQVRDDFPEQQLQGSSRAHENKATPMNPPATAPEVTELRLLLGVTVQALAASTPIAGRELVRAIRDKVGAAPRTFAGELVKALESELSDLADTFPRKHKARGSR